MIAWTLTTQPPHRPATLTAHGTECDRAAAVNAAAGACRNALLDARTLSARNGIAPRYIIAIGGAVVITIGLGVCRTANFEGVLDTLAVFDGSAPTPVHLL